MKRFFKPLLAIAAIATLAFSAHAQVVDYGYVAKTATGATNAEAIWPANTEKTLRLVSFDATTDSTTSQLQMFGGTRRWETSAASGSSATNLTVLSNTGATANDVIVVQLANGTCFSAKVHSTSGSTIIYTTAALGTAVAAGDSVYRMSNQNNIAINNTTLRWSGEGLFASQLRNPLLLRLFGTNAAVTINSAVCKYD